MDVFSICYDLPCCVSLLDLTWPKTADSDHRLNTRKSGLKGDTRPYRSTDAEGQSNYAGIHDHHAMRALARKSPRSEDYVSNISLSYDLDWLKSVLKFGVQTSTIRRFASGSDSVLVSRFRPTFLTPPLNDDLLLQKSQSRTLT